jgi:hypothetical protein
MSQGTIYDLLRAWDASRLSNISFDERQTWAIRLIDEWYHNLIRPHRPRPPEDMIRFAMSIFGTTLVSSEDVIRQRHFKLTTAMQRFTHIMRQPELAIISSEDIDIPPSPSQRLAITRMNAIRKALDNLCNAAASVASMQQISTTPFVEIGQMCTAEKPDEETTPYIQLTRWLENYLLRLGARRGKNGVMVRVSTKLGMFTGFYKLLCPFDKFMSNYLPAADRRIWDMWPQYSNKFDYISRRILADARIPQLPDLDEDPHLRSFENGIFNSKTLEFKPYGISDWTPERLTDYNYATTDAERRAVREEVMTEIEAYQENTNGSSNVRVSDVGGYTDKQRTNASVWDDIGTNANVDQGLFKASMMYTPIHLSTDTLHIPWQDIDVPNWNGLFSKQGYNTDDEMLVINGMMGRSMFDVSSGGAHDGDGWQVMLLFKGPPGNGKGLCIQTLQQLYPIDRIASLTNKPEGIFYGMDFEGCCLMLLPEMNNNFSRNMDMAELMSFVSAERVVLKVKKGNQTVIEAWKAQLVAATNEMGLDGRGWGRRVVVIPMSNEIAEADVDPDLPKKLRQELPKLIVLWARSYHLLRERVAQGGAGLKHVLPERFKRAMLDYSNRLSPFQTYLTESSQVLLLKDHLNDPNEDPESFYLAWDDLKAYFNAWIKVSNGRPVNMTEEDQFLPVLRTLGIHFSRETLMDPITKQDRITKWCKGVKSLLM